MSNLSLEWIAGPSGTALGGTAAVKYVFFDHQGSTRAVLNGSGNVVARHDYLPFGEELWSGVGMRTAAQQHGAMDQNRNRYALTEKDEGTGLDHTIAGLCTKGFSFPSHWEGPRGGAWNERQRGLFVGGVNKHINFNNRT